MMQMNSDQSSFSGSIWMFFSPAAFFSQYFLTQASKVLPAAVAKVRLPWARSSDTPRRSAASGMHA